MTRAKPGSTALSRDLADFLIELSIAIHKHSMYPPGHPSLGPAASGVEHRLRELMQKRSTLSLGVARHQLVIEGIATDSKNPVLRDLAGRLHAHHLGAVTFSKGATAFEVEGFLQSVATDPERSGEPLGLGSPAKRRGQPHIKLYPVAYDRLQLMDEERADEEEGPGDKKEREARTRSAQLWLGLARAAMALEEPEDPEDDEGVETEPAMVAQAITERTRGSAYDQVIVGYLLQIADEVKSAGGSDALQLKNRMNKLVSHLEPETLQQLLAMGGETKQRRRFLLDATEGMSADAIIKLAQAAGQSEGQTISHSMLRILQKLAQHAESGPRAARAAAEQSVRDQVTELIAEWSLTDPNPDEYTRALQKMARSSPMYQVATEGVFRPEPKRLVQMALEVNSTGPTVLRAINDLTSSRQFKWLVDLMDEAKAGEAANTIWKNLATSERLAELLGDEPIDVEALDGLLPRLGSNASEPMIEALVEADSRQARRVLLDRLVRLGPSVAPLAIARLADSRWYVQRNMLAIIGELPDLPQGFEAEDFFRHPDERVRREALRIMFAKPSFRTKAICRAISDTDERTIRLGLAAAMEACPKAAVPLIISRAATSHSEDIRLAAVRVLAELADPAALDVLVKLAAPRKAMLRMKLPPKTPVYLAVLKALGPHREDRRVAAVLQAAAASKDPEIVAAATGAGGAGAP